MIIERLVIERSGASRFDNRIGYFDNRTFIFDNKIEEIDHNIEI
jgi:hypothetical protein